MGPALLAALPALLQGGGTLLNMFGARNPARNAGNDLGKIQGYGQQAYNPFIQQGQQAGQQLSPMYQSQAQNPTGQYNDIMSQYQPSAGYQYKQGKLNQMMHNTAAAGGYAGTGGDQQQRGELTNSLMGEDMQQFLKDILGIQGAGMKGLEGQAERGYGAAGNLADYMGTAGSQNAGANYMKQLHGNESMQSGLGMLASLIGGKDAGAGGLSDMFSQLFGGGKGSATSYTDLKSLDPNRAMSQKAASSGLFR